jgi:segregation and condensation protein A
MEGIPTLHPDAAPHSSPTVHLEGFDGPLDVLLLLIRQNDMNIYDIPIARITDQFLQYLDYAVTLDLVGLADFYAMAADLIHIKTRMLLPIEVNLEDSGFEDPRQELVEKLIEYQKFKKLSTLVEERVAAEDWNLEREKMQRPLPFEDAGLWEQVDTWTLLQDMQKIFLKYRNTGAQEIMGMVEEITVNEKLALLSELLDTKGECMFTDLLVRGGNVMDVICAFMAILEAVKARTAGIYQNRMFGDIKICRR